ncbi:MAG: peptidoglycan-binding protein, partial [Firmicutes bacterium]|nr:peptidoglycan-binding protein [Bacillota bacterium]
MAKKLVKKSIALVLTAMIAAMMLITGTPVAFAETPTNVGLAAHALRAYREGWSYVWGGTSYGAVDCSGLIYSYHGVGGCRVDMLGSSSDWGYVSNGIPRVHGLGLHHPGHVGVYIGSGAAVDARDEYSGVVYHNVYNKNWNEWFKIAGVSYPYSGWVLLDGDSYYYEDGQYIVDTSRTMDGITYYFDSAGVSSVAPPSSAYQATDYSTASVSSSQSYYDDDDDDDYEEQQRAAEEARRKAEEEEKRQEEARRKAEEEKRKAEEAKRKAEEEAKRKAEEEAKRKAEEEAKRKAEEEKRKAEEAKRQAEEEARRKQEEEDAKVIAERDNEDDAESKTVSSIQNRLYELGYLTDKATGYYGEETVNAVMLFQSRNELEVSGIVTAKTYQILKSVKATNNFSVLEQGTFDDGSSVPITALQTRLTELKYYYDDITGFYGDMTASAVKQFQKNNEMEVTGIADPDTQLRIFSSDAKVNPNAGSVSYGESGAMVLKLQKRLIELRY